MPSPEKQLQGVLEVFAYRARRVEAHSLATDKDALLALAEKSMTLDVRQGDDGEELFILIELPMEEAMESLASRCRPFVVEGDSVHYAAVLNALGFFVRSDGELAAAVAVERKSWAGLRRDAADPLGYLSRTGMVGAEPGPRQSPLVRR